MSLSGSCCAMGPLMLIANEASMRTASKGGLALKTAPLSSGAIVDRRFVSITTKRERYSLAVSLPLFVYPPQRDRLHSVHSFQRKISVDNFPNVQVHDEVVHLLDPSQSHQGWLKCKTSEVIKELSLSSGSHGLPLGSGSEESIADSSSGPRSSNVGPDSISQRWPPPGKPRRNARRNPHRIARTRRTGYLSACEHVPIKALVCLCHSLLGL